VSAHYQIEGRSAAAISASVETGIRTGALPPGTALPPVRSLADELGVAPATVAAAYRQLRQRALVETAGRNGTHVRAAPPIAARTGRLIGRVALPEGVVDLSTGEPDRELLPPVGPLLLSIAAEQAVPSSYRDCGAWPVLVERATSRLAADGVPMAGAAVTVTGGALDAIERLLAAHLRPGDRVGIEDPGWANVIELVAALSLEAVPMPVDDEGPTVEGVRRVVQAGAAALVLTSRAQNPTGAAVSARRAAALRALVSSVLVIEDDHAAEMEDVPLATLAGAGRSWAFVRSVSKPYGPDLRLAVVAGDEATIARVEGRMRLGMGWVSTVLQRVVVAMWDDATVAARVAGAKSEYARRRRAVLDALAERGVPARGRTGINVWVPTARESTVVAGLRERGFVVAPGSLFRQASPPGVRVSVGCLRMSDVESLADAFAEALAEPPVTR
jgi:DNA-binding transcriptional MocR family regulator